MKRQLFLSREEELRNKTYMLGNYLFTEVIKSYLLKDYHFV
jgi:hypothetical protein